MQHKMDPIINLVVGMVVDITLIYPTFIFPESKLGADLEMDINQIEELRSKVNEAFTISLETNYFAPNLTLQELVSHVKDISSFQKSG